MGNFDPSSATPVDAPTGGGTFDPSSAQLVDDSPSLGARALGLIDAGVAGANQLVVGTGASIARTANRLLPDALFGAGTGAQTEADINNLQNRLTYHPQSDAGQGVGNAVSGAIAPVGKAIGSTVGAVVGNDNVPAVMDALSVLGLKTPMAAVKGILGTEAPAATGSLVAAKAADQAARDAGLGTAGLASGNPAIQAVEQKIASTPILGTGLKSAIEQSNAKLGLTANEIVSNLADGADTSAQNVGRVLQDQVKAASDAAKEGSRQGYEAIQDMLPDGATIPVSNARSILGNLTKIDGAPATAEAVVPSDIRGIYQALEKDAGLSGQLPYEAVQKLRTAVGQKIDWSPFTSNPSNGMLKTVYGALTRDLNDGASSFGPDVAKAVSDTNASYAKAAAARNTLGSVMDKVGGPEKVYNAVYNTTKDGSSTLDAVMKYSSPSAQRLLAASVLERMGTATAGAQNAAGKVFSADQFLTNWNRISPEAKQSLFGSLPNGYTNSINDLVSNVGRLKAYGKVLGTKSPVFTGLGNVATTAAIVEAMAHGVAGFKTLGATYGANKALALALTNPQTAKALARISGDLANNAITSIARVYAPANHNAATSTPTLQ